MQLEKLPDELTVCKLSSAAEFPLDADFYFIGKTDEELSLVCRTADVPVHTTDRSDDWRGFRIKGVLDFALIGILSKLTTVLSDNAIGLFAVSTYNTDYLLVRAEDFDRAALALATAGYEMVEYKEKEGG